jgi:eukaryotic-like serine/threonine-protein kinase
MGASSLDRSSIRFGAYELDLPGGVLRKGGIRIRCQEQPLQVLAALAERPGELVTREELRRRVWPGDTFVDFDHALNTAIKKIRAALNDDADSPRYIETVPRRGYRFIAQVEKEPEGAVEQQSALVLAPQPSARPKRHWLLALAGTGLAVCVLLGFTWRLAPWHGEASTSPEFQRLTFDLPELGTARFTPDGASVVYSAGWHSHNPNTYSQRLGTPGFQQQLGITNAWLLAVSPQAELAVLGKGLQLGISEEDMDGTLGSVSLGGGTPRELLPEVSGADWSPSGQLAVVRRVGDKRRLEFPVGKVLYETVGCITAPRFSPRGDSIAFLDQPILGDDRGSVAIIDLNGHKRTLSGFWESLRGLAWGPRGDEVWFAATRSGVSRALYAVNLSGQEHRVLGVAGGLSLRDISPDGRLLISRDNQRLGILFAGAGETKPRDLSWKDWSMATDISSDGKEILFGEEGENSGPSYQVGLRPTDGSAPIILGSGIAQSLSPDGKWALSVMPPPTDQMVLLPTGAGSSKILERGSVQRYRYTGARWLPDGKQIVFVGRGEGHGPRCYVQSIDGGNPRALTPDGMEYCSISPTGTILALAEDSRVLLYRSVSSEQPDREFKFEAGEWPSAWTADGKFVYLVQTLQSPANISRFEIATGRRSPWKQLILPQTGNVMKTEGVVISPDGQSYAYTYSSGFSDLYLVQGLK